ncbi:MAG: hypothetical protein RIR00_327 [Pseudomonadota bacterium]|jgi:DNA-binding response OmpR family regulator
MTPTAPETPAIHSDAGKRIFIVEDEAEVARLIRNVLVDFKFHAEIFRTGGDLLRQLRNEEPDLCIVDLGLPDMDGMDLVRELREKHDCGVLILTGRGYLSDRVMGLEIGADDYIVKPFEPRELVARVRSILRRCEMRPAGATVDRRHAHFSGWTFDPGNFTLIAPDGQETAISAAEAHMLMIFLNNPNRILQREQLLGERDNSPYDRAIDVRISRLRRKIEGDPNSPRLIKTVYGAGYLFSSTVRWE